MKFLKPLGKNLHNLWNHPKFVSSLPVVTTAFFGSNAIAQILRIAETGSARDQSLAGYFSQMAALVLILHLYNCAMPQEKLARYGIIVELILYGTAATIVGYLRYW